MGLVLPIVSSSEQLRVRYFHSNEMTVYSKAEPWSHSVAGISAVVEVKVCWLPVTGTHCNQSISWGQGMQLLYIVALLPLKHDVTHSLKHAIVCRKNIRWECKAVSCALTMAVSSERPVALSYRASEEGARMLKEWPRKAKREKIKWRHNERRSFCEFRG